MNDGNTISAIEPLDNDLEVFKPLSWVTKIKFIKQLILDNNILISILGEQGSGKTTFAHLLQTTLDAEIKSVLMSAISLFNSDFFWEELCGQFNYEGEATAASFIAQCNAQQAHLLLIIDDAQYLPNVFIDELLSAMRQQDHHGYFHVCLVSDFAIVDTLNDLALTHEDMIHSIELGPLNEAETTMYVQQRLSRPGMDIDLNEESLKQFYQLTEGNIVGINTQMLGFFSQRAERRHGYSLTRVGVVAGVVIAAAAVIYLGMPQKSQLPPSSELVHQTIPQPVLTVPMPPPVQAQVALTSEIPAYYESSSSQALQATPLRRVDLIAANAQDTTSDDSMVVMDKVVVIPKVKSAPVKVATVTTKKVQITKKTSVKVNMNAPAAGKQGQFTIQLLASSNKAELERFSQAHRVSKARILRTKNQGKVWYVLALGDYEQRDLAKQAVNHLPAELTKFKPWVRALSDLKQLA